MEFRNIKQMMIQSTDNLNLIQNTNNNITYYIYIVI